MFGTDGVRGTPGESPLDATTVTRLGAATVRALDVASPRVLVVRDTRDSGPGLEAQLAAGVAAEGGVLVSAGVLPTPAAAVLGPAHGFDAAFVISASHNPYPDNGIKLLTAGGEKVPAEVEATIAALVADAAWRPTVPDAVAPETADLAHEYVAFTRATFGAGRAAGRLAVDCANGAMSAVAPAVFEQLGFDVVTLGTTPDGRNINDACGSTHPEALAELVRREACVAGVAFDGDGDRAILVDADGRTVDGDAMLFVCASHRHARGRLRNDGIVATVMSNLGLEVALRERGITVHRCPVGDRSVREHMVRHDVPLGGEQSGHLIFSDRLPTGDGLVTALSVLEVVHETGRGLAPLLDGFVVYPQLLVNVPVSRKPPIEDEPRLVAAVQAAEAELGDHGRVVVRYSGTEWLFRVMIEGPETSVVERLAHGIADEARACLGEPAAGAGG